MSIVGPAGDWPPAVADGWEELVGSYLHRGFQLVDAEWGPDLQVGDRRPVPVAQQSLVR